MTSPLLETRHLSKAYPGTQALSDVSLSFAAGQVHAIVGRNGAGKSTLVRILAGVTAPSSGEVVLDGSSVTLRSPKDALDRGIATVHQELSLVPELTVAENVLLGRLPRHPILRFAIDRRALHRRAEEILAGMGVSLDPRGQVSRLSFARQQVVEIARALSFEPRVVLLDEPTSALSRTESESLFALVRTLAARGVVVLHVTHRLDELARVADTVTALRDGRHVATIAADRASPERLVDMMFGAAGIAARGRQPREATGSEPVVLAARGLTVGTSVVGADLELRRGEVLGLAGMLGSGRTELLMALFGALRADAGDVLVAGKIVCDPSPRRMKRRGLALVPEDRKRQGLALPLSVLDNASLPSLARIARGGFLTRRLQRRAVTPVLRDVRLVASSLDVPVSMLSGGNQQKVVVGKWLVERPLVLLLDEPTKGIDLEARRQLFDAVERLAREGMAVLVVSSELEELLEVCDRILVMRDGRIACEVAPADTPLPRLLALAMGA